MAACMCVSTGRKDIIVFAQALREVERQRSREKLQDEKGTDVHYLKNVVLKLYETGMHSLLRAPSTPAYRFAPQNSMRQVAQAFIKIVQAGQALINIAIGAASGRLANMQPV